MASEEGLSDRQRRAVAVVGGATMVILAGAGLYLRLTTPAGPNAIGGLGIDRTIVSSDPMTYDFITPTVGWAAVNPRTRNGSSGTLIVFKTIDGARHWHEELVQHNSSSYPVFLQLQFVDEKHGFLAAGTPFDLLYRTSDGGATWASVPFPGSGTPVVGMLFINATDGWVITRGDSATLYATADSGSTWRFTPTAPNDAVDLGLGGDAEIWTGSWRAGTPHVYVSTDDGQSWGRKDLPQPPDTAWVTGDTAGTQLGVPIVRSDVQLLPKGAVLVVVDVVGSKYRFVSMNGGAAWRYISDPPGALGFADSFHWWAMNGTSLFKSSDAGATWMLVTNTLPDWQFSPHLFDGTHAWADLRIVGGFGLAMTHDGGLHWSRAKVPLYN